MVAILKGSQCPELVELLTLLKDLLHPDWYADLLEQIARVRSENDRAAARVLLDEVRRNPLLFSRPPPTRREMRKAHQAAVTAKANRKARRAARGRA